MAAAAKPELLKIGLVLDSGLDSLDGVQQYVLAIGGWLESQGHEVHYLVGKTTRRDITNLHSLGSSMTVKFNGNKGSVPLMARKTAICRLLAREQFDVLHVQMPHHPFLAQRVIMAAGPRTAVIGTFHIAPYSRLVSIANWGLGWWLRPSLKRFDRIVSVSPAAAEFARRTFRIRTEVLPNVVDYRRFHSAKPLPRYNDEVPTILFLGRLVPRKGCELLLEAVVKLQQEPGLRKFRVVVCGRGPMEAKLRRFAADNGLQDVVEFAGFVGEADKLRYYASADIAVFPSSGGESFGIVLLEAMASGRPVVLAGNNPGYRSVMAPRPELLFDPHDATVLAGKLKLYLTDESARQQASKARADYARQFDIAVVAPKLLTIYRQALRKRRGQ